jgi:septal ring factor EnvC (AmiA/AmiB activator)
MTISTVLWGTDLRKTVTSTAALIAGVATAITAVPPAWSALGLPEIASKSFVDGRIEPVKVAESDTQSILRELQIEVAEGKKERTEDSISRWQLQHDRAEDTEGRSIIERQLQELQDTKTRLDDQIKTLRSLK